MSLSLFDHAQRKAIQILRDVEHELHANMSKNDILECVYAQASTKEVSGWLRPPLVRISTKTGIQVLQKGSIIQIHIQPIFGTVFGSVGRTISFESPEEKIVSDAKELCFATCTFANRRKCIGELFVFAHSWCINHRMELEHKKNIGHRCFSKETSGVLWPYSARALSMLRRHQIQWYNPRRMEGIFAIHPFLEKHDLFAGFAEMISVEGEERKLLGRDSFDELGT